MYLLNNIAFYKHCIRIFLLKMVGKSLIFVILP